MANYMGNTNGPLANLLSNIAPNLYNWYDQKTNAYKYDSMLQEEAYQQNLALQQQQQQYEAYMSNTEYQRQVQDMKAAGLNVGAIGGGGGGGSAAGGTGLSTQTPSETHKAMNGNSDAGIEEATQALLVNAILEMATKHPAEVLEQIKKSEHRVVNTAKEILYNG